MKPITIGIGGGSASGKSTYAKNLAATLGEYNVARVKMDDYYKEPLPQMVSPVTQETNVDYNHPDAVDYTLALQRVFELQSLNVDIIIIEGAFVFCYDEIREICDLKIFIDLDTDARMYRRVKRNTDHFKNHEKLGDFNYQAEYYLNYAKHREQKYALTTKVFADIILNGYKLNKHAIDVVVAWVKTFI
jgi:uridine kinase